MHYYGLGVEINYEPALEHYSKSPRDAQSVYSIASMTERGHGTPRSVETARELYELAKELGEGSGGEWDGEAGPRKTYAAFRGEYSHLPAVVAVARMEAEAIFCDCAGGKGVMAGFAEYLIECMGDLGVSLCGAEAGGGAFVDFTVGGLGVEMWVAAMVGVCTICSAVMGPCFARALASRIHRNVGGDAHGRVGHGGEVSRAGTVIPGRSRVRVEGAQSAAVDTGGQERGRGASG